MAGDLNHVTVIGRLVRDPETKYTPSGTAITKFSIANNDIFVQNNERKEYVSYFDVNVWGNQAVNCEKYLKKGSQVAVEGYLRQNRWTDQNGQTRSKIEITANSVQFLTPAAGAGGGGNVGAGGYSQPQQQQQQRVQQPQQQPQQQFQQQQGNGVNNGFIEDPWGDSGSSGAPGGGGGGGFSDPYSQQGGSDDDIPF